MKALWAVAAIVLIFFFLTPANAAISPRTLTNTMWAFVIILAALLIIFVNIVGIISFPWMLVVLLAIYGAVTYYKQKNLINTYLGPVIFGWVGGIITAYVWRSEWKRLIAVGILSSVIYALLLMDKVLPLIY